MLKERLSQDVQLLKTSDFLSALNLTVFTVYEMIVLNQKIYKFKWEIWPKSSLIKTKCMTSIFCKSI